MRERYQPAPGAHISADDVRLVAQALERVLEKYGEITPTLVVETAIPETSPLHRFFEWNAEKGAAAFRLQQAGQLIRSVRVVVSAPKQPVRLARAFVSVVTDGNRRSYKPIAVVMTNPQLRAQLLEEAHAALEAMERKYGTLAEWGEVFAAAARVRKRQRG